MIQTRESFNTQDKLSSVIQLLRTPRIGEHRVEQNDEEISTLKTEIYLSTLQYQQLVPLATTFAGNDATRLKGIFEITSSADNLSVKTNAIRALFTRWGFVHRTSSDLVPTGKDKSEVQIFFHTEQNP